jgi:hypothetical protein
MAKSGNLSVQPLPGVDAFDLLGCDQSGSASKGIDPWLGAIIDDFPSRQGGR